MDRCKLEYMIRGVDLKEYKQIVYEIDPKGDYFLYERYSQFFLNPNDPNLDEYFPEFMYLPEMKEELIEKGISQYKKINELCIKNNICPIFKDPTNVMECEKTRLDILKLMPEEKINDFFGVSGIRDYKPPKYNND